jgi:hypothetical protein
MSDRDTACRVAAIGMHAAAVKCRELGMTWAEFLAVVEDVWDNSYKYVVDMQHMRADMRAHNPSRCDGSCADGDAECGCDG